VQTERRRRARARRRASRSAAAPRVLVVDDEPPDGDEASNILSQLGYDVLIATSAARALRYLAVRSYDCILVNLGHEALARPVIEEVRRYPPETVGLIVTASGADVSSIDALREGAQDYVSKPFDADMLKASVARAIERASLVRTMRELVEDFDTTNLHLRAFADQLQRRVDRMTSQLRRKVAQLDEANRQLAEERRRREEFIAMVAHDLGGPLTMVNSYVQLLAQPALASDVQQRARTVVVSEIRRVVRLLRDLTDAVPLTSGRFRVQPVTCDLSVIVREQVELARLRAEQHRVSLDVPSEPVRVMCDPDRFAQVLANLLGNALKYSPGGQITVRLWVEAEEARLSIRDEGRGIPPDQLQSIFEPGVRIRNGQIDAEKPASGAGLGLYIARGIIDALGGRIWAESDGVHGSAFHVALPLCAPSY
jgi:signal transduction histidine kinase